jgi:polygalacturonase
VVLTKSRFDVGDDAICIKSGKNEDGRKRGIPSENLIIKNCVVYHGHGGVTVGSEMSGGVKNMHVSGCTFIGTDVGLRFKSTRGRGGVVEGVYISDVDMIDIPTNAISFNLYYGGLSVSEMLDQNEGSDTSEEVFEVTEETPQFKDIYMKNITCRGAYQAIYLQGLPEMNLENVNLENMKMVAENGLVCVDADGVNIKNLDLKTSKPPAMMFYNSKNVDVDNLTILKSGAQEIVIDGTHSKNISIEVQSPSSLKGMVKIGDNVANSSISVTEM